jgi:hypothetical protein
VCQAGLSLVELMLAVALATGLLAASWSWVWGLCATCRGRDATLDGWSRVAAARRLLDGDISISRLAPAVSPGCTIDSLALQIAGPDDPPVTVVYRWDAARRVLWRQASGCHVADEVTAFRVTYLAGNGVPVLCGANGSLSVSDARRVRALEVSLSIVAGSVPVGRTWLCGVGPC